MQLLIPSTYAAELTITGVIFLAMLAHTRQTMLWYGEINYRSKFVHHILEKREKGCISYSGIQTITL